ncbi:endolytic transglycosylase MltG [Rhodobacteraceae bacterium 2376]|uniref:Endolytic murein transglycosylase n=1 Tax=Rhabdonatronobacter sediminivivens TaxID=2743469 RepID=A0A7Z0HX42_9RHOB|nr:endolytic transglycosylase MltG [Rhabdonatronobacter sediminivivens]NYS23921.1 endolytic transglycosylase MltG [Rhabdonatronobacter sediminivivens]
MFRHIAANALTLMIVGLAVLGGVIAWGQREFVAQGPLETAICLRVEPGATLRGVSRSLEEQGAISNPAVFRIGAQYTERAGGLRFGSYLVPEGASMDEIMDIVTRGGASTCGSEVLFRVGVTSAETILRELDPQTQRFVELARFGTDVEDPPEEYASFVQQGDIRYRITVAEGATSWQIWDALNRAEFLSGEVEEVPDEGWLAPDSYEVQRGADRGALLADMRTRQERILDDLWETRQEGLPYDSPYEALIMASIIEKETGVADERRQVASVFVNRLRVPMRLQTDPTVIYGITQGRGTLGRGIRQSELNAVTPYNTYRIDGMPPTPIANPGRAAIAAALDPDDTPYIYFVADGTGGHTFSTNLADHNRAVARWREIEAEMRAREQQQGN